MSHPRRIRERCRSFPRVGKIEPPARADRGLAPASRLGRHAGRPARGIGPGASPPQPQGAGYNRWHHRSSILRGRPSLLTHAACVVAVALIVPGWACLPSWSRVAREITESRTFPASGCYYSVRLVWSRHRTSWCRETFLFAGKLAFRSNGGMVPFSTVDRYFVCSLSSNCRRGA
jgi:hypothetical protein